MGEPGPGVVRGDLMTLPVDRSENRPRLDEGCDVDLSKNILRLV